MASELIEIVNEAVGQWNVFGQSLENKWPLLITVSPRYIFHDLFHFLVSTEPDNTWIFVVARDKLSQIALFISC